MTCENCERRPATRCGRCNEALCEICLADHTQNDCDRELFWREYETDPGEYRHEDDE